MTWPRIERHAELASTMDRARELAETGAPAGTVVVADFQTAGRGTRDRIWLAPAGSCLMFTIISRPTIGPASLADLPARVSEAICGYLRATLGLACEVKPPNDIVVDGRKLCGVLCASKIVGERVEHVLIGIGLNTRMSRDQLPLETATSLLIETGGCPGHDELLDGLLSALEEATSDAR
ncbi:MAG TPA: biotin--[acetyl-CoA-carboxylase] ligase [Chloroflexi bacterium]|jgi:BirA family biotin operon repressor/biotin-[acetyl-CoA-carboxylase] ligase|nr:biotin--[acetyl-CoA-carboxylase] ligase [Chloroflexota bacterium]